MRNKLESGGADTALFRSIIVLSATEGVATSTIVHTALRLTLRRFTGDDEMRIRTGGADSSICVPVGDGDSFRTIARAVRDASLQTSGIAGVPAHMTFGDDRGAQWECSVEIAGSRLELTFRGYTPAFIALEATIPGALAALLVCAAADPGCPNDALALVDDAGAARLVEDGDGPGRPAPACATLDRIVAARAVTAPGAVAVIDGGTSVTYGALLKRAACTAAVLRANGAGPGVRVGVCSAPSASLLATILAIWSAGAVYVPLDPALPPARLDDVVIGAGVEFVVAPAATSGRVRACRTVLMPDGEAAGDNVWQSDASGTGGAYVLYTSGSTGAPKGVEIAHDAATNAILAALDVCGLSAGDTTLYRTAISFDLSVYDIFTSLAAGATLVVVPVAAAGDPNALIELIAAHAITHILLGPALLAAMLDRRSFPRAHSLRLVTCGGEALSWSLCERFFARSGAQLYNLYGPSEATMLVTLHPCRPEDGRYGEATAPLGTALANNHVSVRDAAQRPVPPGAIGEITIGGVQLARGYIGNPDETRRRFVPDPARRGALLYRTGDLARQRPDGSITYLGRNDKQVKIRGIRVEPGEVAATIERIDGVTTAVVCAQRRPFGDVARTVLVAYVVRRNDSSLTVGTLREALSAAVPSFLVPADIVFVDRFPLTPSGKIDEKALAAIAPVVQRVAPRPAAGFSVRGILREQLRALWERLLDQRGICDDDDFFDIGGDSLSAVRLMLLLEETFGQTIAIAEFADNATIGGLAALLADDSSTDPRDAFAFNEHGTRPPFVYLHGDFAGGRYAWTLGRLLGDDQPLTVIPPHGLRGRPPATTVRKMAADVVTIVTRMHPDGPLRIGGFSAAGLVAYAAARILRAQGRVVLDTVLVGTNLANAAALDIAQSVQRWPVPAAVREPLLRLAAIVCPPLDRFARMPWRRRLRRLADVGLRRNAPEHQPIELELGREYRAYQAAHAAYIPQPYAGKMFILWPRGEGVPMNDVRRDWQRLAADVTVEAVSGTHLGAVSRHLDEIAAALRHRFAGPVESPALVQRLHVRGDRRDVVVTQ